MGLSNGLMRSCWKPSSPNLWVQCSRFSPKVRPVTVMLSPSISLFFNKNAKISIKHRGNSDERASCVVYNWLTWNTTDLVDVFHNIFSARFDVCKEGDTVWHILEVVDVQLNPHGVSHGNKMKHGVCRTTQNHGKDLEKIVIVTKMM